MGYLSTDYIIYAVVRDRNLILLLSDQCITGTYMGIVQIYSVYFIRNDFYSDFCIYSVLYYRWSVGSLI